MLWRENKNIKKTPQSRCMVVRRTFTRQPGFQTQNINKLQGSYYACRPDLWPPWVKKGISPSCSEPQGGFIWVLSGIWWFCLLPPQTRELGQGYKQQVAVVVKVWGQSVGWPATGFNKATHTITVNDCCWCETECLILASPRPKSVHIFFSLNLLLKWKADGWHLKTFAWFRKIANV